jgi:hypothetical protein
MDDTFDTEREALAHQADEWADRIAAKMAAATRLNEGETRYLLATIAGLRAQAEAFRQGADYIEAEVAYHVAAEAS